MEQLVPQYLMLKPVNWQSTYSCEPTLPETKPADSKGIIQAFPLGGARGPVYRVQYIVFDTFDTFDMSNKIDNSTLYAMLCKSCKHHLRHLQHT